MVDQYSSDTEDRLAGAEDVVKGTLKKAAGAVAGREKLAEEGEEQADDGAALVEKAHRASRAKSAKARAVGDIALGGGEGRA